MHLHRARKSLEIRAETTGLVDLWNQEDIRHGELVANAIAPLSGFRGSLCEQCLEGAEAPLDPVFRPCFLGLGIGGDSTQCAEIVKWLDPAIDDFGKLPDACAQPRLTRQEETLGKEIIEQLDDGDGFRHDSPVDDEAGDDPHRASQKVLGLDLLAFEEVDGARLVRDRFVCEREPHPPGRRGAPILVENELCHGRSILLRRLSCARSRRLAMSSAATIRASRNVWGGDATRLREGHRNRLHCRPPVEKNNILLAIVLGLLGANLVVYWTSQNTKAPRKSPPAVTYAVGQEIDVAITLVSTDAKALACASASEVAGRHCELEASNPERAWSKSLSQELPAEQRVLAPYKTTEDLMFLIPGLFSEPALIERLKIDPPVFGIEHSRFTAHCKLRILGKVPKLTVRWAPSGPWYPATNVFVGSASDCTVSE